MARYYDLDFSLLVENLRQKWELIKMWFSLSKLLILSHFRASIFLFKFQLANDQRYLVPGNC